MAIRNRLVYRLLQDVCRYVTGQHLSFGQICREYRNGGRRRGRARSTGTGNPPPGIPFPTSTGMLHPLKPSTQAEKRGAKDRKAEARERRDGARRRTSGDGRQSIARARLRRARLHDRHLRGKAARRSRGEERGRSGGRRTGGEGDRQHPTLNSQRPTSREERPHLNVECWALRGAGDRGGTAGTAVSSGLV